MSAKNASRSTGMLCFNNLTTLLNFPLHAIAESITRPRVALGNISLVKYREIVEITQIGDKSKEKFKK